jgi:hypothetical protein
VRFSYWWPTVSLVTHGRRLDRHDEIDLNVVQRLEIRLRLQRHDARGPRTSAAVSARAPVPGRLSAPTNKAMRVKIDLPC